MNDKVKQLFNKCNIIEIKVNSLEETLKNDKELLFSNLFYFIQDKNNIFIYGDIFFKEKTIYRKETGEKIGVYSKLLTAKNMILDSYQKTGEANSIKILKKLFQRKITDKESEHLTLFLLEDNIPEELDKELYKFYQKKTDEMIEDSVKEKISFIYVENKKFLEDVYYTNDKIDSEYYTKVNIPLKKFILTFVEKTEKIRDIKDKFTYPIYEKLTLSVELIDKENVDDLLHKYLSGESYDLHYDNIYNRGMTLFTISDPTNIERGFAVFNNFYAGDKETPPYVHKVLNLLKAINEYFGSEENTKDINIYIPSAVMSKHMGYRVKERKPSAVKGHLRHYKSGIVTLVKPHLRNGIGLNYGICVKI